MPPLPPSKGDVSDASESGGMLPPRADIPNTPRQLVVRPTLRHPKPQDAPIATERLSVFIHEMANLLDGTLRCLELARRQVSAGGGSGRTPDMNSGAADQRGATSDTCGQHDVATPTELSALPPHDSVPRIEHSKGDVERRLDVVHAGMSHMVGLLREMSGFASDARSLLEPDDVPQNKRLEGTDGIGCGLSRGVPTLSEAVRHAADVMEPVAADHGIRVSVCLPHEFDSLAARGMFGVVAGAIRNSIESIQQGRLLNGSSGCDDVTLSRAETETDARRSAGSIDVVGGVMDGVTRRAWLEIIDDGFGLSWIEGADPARFFDLGYTTKTGSAGIGLAVAHDTVTRLGGIISLRHPAPAAGGDSVQTKNGAACRGAVLRIEWPASNESADSRGGRT